MDAMANFGIAAHWEYKSSHQECTEVSRRRAARWVQGLLEMQQKAGDSLEFLEHVKADLFPDEVYVFTPKGKIIELPTGATPIDFAYSVHTGLGDQLYCLSCRRTAHASCQSPYRAAKKSISSAHRGPSRTRSWLNFVVTAKARSAIRHFLKNQQHEESVDLGKRLLDQALGQFRDELQTTKKIADKALIKRNRRLNI